MTDLRPCPFCGEKPELDDAYEVVNVACRNHDYHILVSADHRDAAIATWNRRAGAESNE